MTDEFATLNPVQFGPASKGNCGVTAVAVVAGVPFERAFAEIKRIANRGSRWTGRTREEERAAALQKFGVKFERQEVKPCTVAAWVDRYAERNAVYIVHAGHHAFTLHAGRYVDQCTNAKPRDVAGSRIARTRMKGAVKIIARPAAPAPAPVAEIAAPAIISRTEYRRPVQLTLSL